MAKQLENEKILTLCGDLTNSSSTAMQVKINKHLTREARVVSCTLVILQVAYSDALIQVVGEEVLAEEKRFPVSATFLNFLLSSCTVFSRDPMAPEDLESNTLKILEQLLDLPKTRFYPVRRSNGSAHDEPDDYCMLVCLTFMGQPQNRTSVVNNNLYYVKGALFNTFALADSKRNRERSDYMLSIAQTLFQNLGDIVQLLQVIILKAKELVGAERCSVFLIEPETKDLVAKVFETETVKKTEIRIKRGVGVVGAVVRTGRIINVRDCYNDPNFYSGIDEISGFITRDLLCFPIMDEEGVIGVAQLCNKKTGFHFDERDETTAKAFSIFCGLCIKQCLSYQYINEARARQQLANELLMYHMQVSEEAVEVVLNCKTDHNIPRWNDMIFSMRDVHISELSCYAYLMFKMLLKKLSHPIKLSDSNLVRFILIIQNGYRNKPYHNWQHAVGAAHFCFALIYNTKIIEKKILGSIEVLALYISCLCHDLDHRGTNNSFYALPGSHSVIANLYTSEGSVNERHHLAQAICILNSPGGNILDTLSKKEYSACIDLIRHNILATDLAEHFRIMKTIEAMIEETFNPKDVEHRHMLCSLIMTCSDLSDQIKEFDINRKVAKLVYAEFFEQGDLERKMGRSPIEPMDKERASIPALQVSFLAEIIIPTFTLLESIIPECVPLTNSARLNLEAWGNAKCTNLFPPYTNT